MNTLLSGHLINVIGGVFFPSDDQLTSVLKTFGVFAVGFLMRPVGVGNIGDKHGRRVALLLSITLMTLSTVLIAFVPGYQSIGILAAMLVVCLRLLQGISLGEAGNAPFLIEHALFDSVWRNNYCTSLIFKTFNKGIAIVALVSYYSRVKDTFG